MRPAFWGNFPWRFAVSRMGVPSLPWTKAMTLRTLTESLQLDVRYLTRPDALSDVNNVWSRELKAKMDFSAKKVQFEKENY